MRRKTAHPGHDRDEGHHDSQIGVPRRREGHHQNPGLLPRRRALRVLSPARARQTCERLHRAQHHGHAHHAHK